MKKTLAILVAAVMVLCAVVLASCDSEPKTTDPVTTAGDVTTAEPKTTEADATTAEATTEADVTTEPAKTTEAPDGPSYVEDDFYLYEGDPAGHVAISAANNGELACKFTVDSNARLIGLYFESCPSWSTHGESAFVVELYKWENDYDNTILGDPLYTEEFTEWEDNDSCDVDFTEAQPTGFGPGTYMYVFRGTTANIGVWAVDPVDECEYFENGTSSNHGFRVVANLLVEE
ncbi:MAG: acid shock protein [Clostridia bacterium]|nr:acid shock protein [Clostridia bacterium]